jgi:sugar phosphate isomerase/epimerase
MISFKIGVMADSFRLSPREGILAAKKVGAEGVQLYVVSGEMAPENLAPAARKDFKRFVADAGVAFSALCGDLGGHGFELPEEHAPKSAKTVEILRLAHEWECPVVTTHIGVVPSDAASAKYKSMVGCCKKLGDEAARLGVRFAIETGPEPAPLLKRFLEDADSKGLAVNFDPANLKMVLDEDPVMSARLLAPWIAHTHAKDGVHLADWPGGREAVYGSFSDGTYGDLLKKHGEPFREVALGEGQVPWPEYLKALWDGGFRGYLTIEREVGDQPALDIGKAVGFLKDTLARLNP